MRVCLLPLVALSVACTASGPAAPQGARPVTDEIHASSNIVATSSNASGLQVAISLHNVSGRTASVVLSNALPVAVRLLAGSDSTPILVEPSISGGTKLPMVVQLKSGESRSFDRTVPALALATLRAGTYRVKVAVNTSPNALVLDVGSVVLPLR